MEISMLPFSYVTHESKVRQVALYYMYRIHGSILVTDQSVIAYFIASNILVDTVSQTPKTSKLGTWKPHQMS